MNFDVFISYSTKDIVAANATCAALEAARIRCWIAPRDIVAGARWGASIVGAINQCRVMVLIFSGNANASVQVHREVDRAFSRGKAVVPLRIEDTKPSDELAYYLDTVHWLDALTPPLERNLVKLVAIVGALLSAAEPVPATGDTAADAAEAAQVQDEARAEDERRERGASAGQPATGEIHSRGVGAPATPRRFIWSGLQQKVRTRYLAALVGASACAVVLAVIAFLHLERPLVSVISPLTAPGQQSTADLIAAANRGNAEAQNLLGVKYLLGEDGLVRDEVQALDWFRKAALQGDRKAQTNLGDMYFFGRGGVDKNLQQALSWYLKAADQHWPDAEYRLGYMYETGLGVQKDEQRGVAFYRSAAEKGYASAQNALGVLCASGGDGVPQDDRQAVEWYRKAAEQGLAKAEKNLADMYFWGRGFEKPNYQQAYFWYKKAADQKLADAEFRLGYMDEKGLGTEPSEASAVALYKQAASHGSVDAQQALDRLAAQHK
jgi:TPR repeat protein